MQTSASSRRTSCIRSSRSPTPQVGTISRFPSFLWQRRSEEQSQTTWYLFENAKNQTTRELNEDEKNKQIQDDPKFAAVMTPILKRLSEISSGCQSMVDGLHEVEELEGAVRAVGKKTGLTKAIELV